MKFMRDFLENEMNQESSLVENFEDIEQLFTHIENETINDSLQNEMELNQHSLALGALGGGAGANAANIANSNQEPSHTEMSISKKSQGVKAVVANFNNQNIGESSLEDELHQVLPSHELGQPEGAQRQGQIDPNALKK